MSASDFPRIIDEQYQGDPFVKLIKEGDKYYVFNEAASIEDYERALLDWRPLDD